MKNNFFNIFNGFNLFLWISNNVMSISNDNSHVVGVLVSFNPDVKHLSLVLKSICSQISKLVIVDNGSNQQELVSSICSTFPNVIFLSMPKNIGLASAQNVGIASAKEQSASHVILFDQDSIIAEEFIQQLLITESILLSKGNKVAAVGPAFFDPNTQAMYPATVYKGPFIKRIPISGIAIEATYIIASGCLIRMVILDDIGNMRDELFIDYIDVEWCLRAKSLGYSLFIAPKAKMAHTIGDSRISILGRTVSLHGAVRRYYLVRNSFIMLKLSYVPFGYKLRELVFNFFRIIVGVYFSSEKLRAILYALGGVKDGVLGRLGPCKYNW